MIRSRILLAIVCATGAAAAPGGPPPPPPGPALELEHFEQVPADYKQPDEVPATLFNPFRIQAVIDAAATRHDTATISADTVLSAIGRRGVSGLVCEAKGISGRAIIGDEIFGIGDELTFQAEKGTDVVPLVPGASVVLRGVDPENLTFEVTPDGEAPRPLKYSLRAFWR